VGTELHVKPLIGPRTRVIDAAGGSILPGFQDAHIHAPSAGLGMARCRLNDVDGVDAYVATIRTYAESHPDASWIVGEGWSLDSFPRGLPHRSVLDAVVPDRPAYLENRDGHGAWVNSRALEAAGIDARTIDPPAGRVERDEAGEPIGMLQERAMELVARLIPAVSLAEWKDATLRAQTYLHSLGITAWQDAHVEREHLEAYRALAEEGQLTARVVGALWWNRERGEEQVEELLDLRSLGTVGRLRCGSVKIMQDGIVENFTAAMTAPYLDGSGHATAGAGMSFVEPEALNRSVARLDREGFQVHFHAIGDRAVRECLDAVGAASAANGDSDNRHHIAHLQVVHPDDVPRFGRLGVAANIQPFWACLDGQMEHLTMPFLGRARIGWQYPFESLRRTGAVVAMGSDWSVSTPNPLLEIEVAVRRVPVDRRQIETFLPNERLSLRDAISAFTEGSAFVNHLDQETGSLEAGKMADLAVIDRDLFAPDAGPIGDARVVLTLVEGAPVFGGSSLAG
jgi:predicted amidohydrolase YtcJ